MTLEEAQNKILQLIEEAEWQYEWGGSETDNGCLMPGSVDWQTLKTEVKAILHNVRPKTNQPAA